jgi:hypothetical protein
MRAVAPKEEEEELRTKIDVLDKLECGESILYVSEGRFTPSITSRKTKPFQNTVLTSKAT